MYLPSWRLSLKTEKRKMKSIMATPKETRKLKDQWGSWANCVAINGDVSAPRPENFVDQWAAINIGKAAVTICRLKKSHFCLLVVLQSRYESIRLSVLIVFLFKHMGITQNDIPEELRLLHWWNMPSRRPGRGVRTIGSRRRSPVKLIPKQLSLYHETALEFTLRCPFHLPSRNRVYLLGICWLQLLKCLPGHKVHYIDRTLIKIYTHHTREHKSKWYNHVFNLYYKGGNCQILCLL